MNDCRRTGEKVGQGEIRIHKQRFREAETAVVRRTPPFTYYPTFGRAIQKRHRKRKNPRA